MSASPFLGESSGTTRILEEAKEPLALTPEAAAPEAETLARKEVIVPMAEAKISILEQSMTSETEGPAPEKSMAPQTEATVLEESVAPEIEMEALIVDPGTSFPTDASPHLYFISSRGNH